MMRTLVVLVTVVGCGGSGGGGGTHPAVDAPPSHEPDSADGGACHTEKIAFTQADGCGNDGVVEWCIRDNAALQTQLATISSSIHCAPGGGRAMCSATPGLLLCSYPTAFPAQCSTDHGAMTNEVWSDMCEIAALPQVAMIVKTILE